MTARIAVIVVLAVLGAWLLAACEPEPSTPPAARPAVTKVVVVEPNPGAQPAAPAADPGPHNNAQVVTVSVTWLGERTGRVEVSINHVVQPQVGAGRPTKSGGFYTGRFELTIPLLGVVNVGIAWFPDTRGMHAQCAVWHDGLVVDHQGVDTGPCAASWSPPPL